MEALLDKPLKYIDAMVLEETVDTKIVLRVLDTSDYQPWGWEKRRKGKTLCVSMPVSFCNHSHDCCGCLCVHRLEMTMHGKYLMVIEEKQYNY